MRDNLKKLLEEYLEELVNDGMKQLQKPVSRYRLKKLFAFLDENNLSLGGLKFKHAQAYQGWLIENNTTEGSRYASGTLVNFMKTAVGFYNFLKKRGMVVVNPFEELDRIRCEKKLPENLLKEKQMYNLLIHLGRFRPLEGEIRNAATRYRVHVICELLYSTALRIGEAASLEEQDVDLERGEIYLKEGKGGASRIVLLNSYAREVLKLYITEIRPLLKILYFPRDKRLFGAGGNRLGTLVGEVLAQACKKLQYGKMTCHSFRHAVGYHLLRTGCNIRYIQELLGHKQISNTEIYTKVEKDDLREKVDKYHPRRCRRLRNEEVK